MSRLRYNNVLGLLGGSLTTTGTTITFQSAPVFSTIVSPDYIPLILEGSTSSTSSLNFEIIYLTAYTAGATTGTIVRGQEGTTGVSHASGAGWASGPTVSDFPTGITYTPAAAPPPSRALRSAAQTVSASTWTKLLLDTTSFDPNGYMDVATNHRYNAPAAGYYQVNAQTFVSSGFVLAGIYKNGVVYVYGENAPGSTAGNMTSNVSDVIQCNAGDYLELWIFAQNGSIPSGNENFLSVVPLTQQSIASQITPVVARAHLGTAGSTGTGAQKVLIDTKDYDPSAGWDTTNHRFVAPVAGYYQVNGEVYVQSNTTVFLYLYKNGLAVTYGGPGNVSTQQVTISDVMYLGVGDYVELWVNVTGSSVAYGISSNSNYLSVAQVVGQPGANLAAARAYRNAALTITANTATKVPLDTTSFDPNGNMDVATNHRYNVPAAGPYLVVGAVNTSGVAGSCYALIYKNGVEVAEAGNNASGEPTVVDIVQCNAGDYIELWIISAATSLGVGAGSHSNFLSVTPLVSAVTSTPGFGSSGSSSAATNVARAYRNAALSFSANTWTKVPLDTVSFDPASAMDAVTNHRYNVPVAGYYEVSGQTTGASGSGTTYVGIYKNGTQINQSGSTSSGVQGQACVSDVIFCNAGDYLELWINSTLTSLAANGSIENYLSVAQVQAPGGTGNANALPAGASYQNGVINSTDLALSALSITTGTAALTFTLASANPVIIKDASGLLVPVTRSGVTTTLAPSSLPASTFSEVLGVEMDTNGLLYLAVGAQVSGQLSTGSAIATNSPSVTPGRIRLADVGVYNNVGVYNFCNNSTTPAQGTNWIDRRPWARGAEAIQQRINAGNYTTTAVMAPVDSTNLSQRIECSGAPLKITLCCFVVAPGGTNADLSIDMYMDGASLNNQQYVDASGFYVEVKHETYLPAPTPGSHLFVPYWETDSSGHNYTMFSSANQTISFVIEEVLKTRANNGTV